MGTPSATAKVWRPEASSAPITEPNRHAPAAWNLPPGSPPPAVAPFEAANAKEHQAAWAKHLNVDIELKNSLGMRFVLIPPGEFLMGSTEAEVARLAEEAKARKADKWYIDKLASDAPQHRVRITTPFYLGVCEVTQAEYERVAESNPSNFRDKTHPVEMVDWDDASAFCRQLQELPQEQAAHAAYRLPSEAEWEYACRAGTTTVWYATDDVAALKEYAWFNVSANAEGTTHPVGEKKPNAWGLHDLHGNVGEWCQDWYGIYKTTPTDDPPGAPQGSSRIVRGSSWFRDAFCCRAACRNWLTPISRYDDLGFRVVRQVPSASP